MTTTTLSPVHKAKTIQIKSIKQDLSTTFNDNLSLPIHNWYRFSAGFSANWCRELIMQEKQKGRRRVLDPFSGSGTVLIESEFCQMEGIGVEAHPFIARIARTKLLWKSDINTFDKFASNVLKKAKRNLKKEIKEYPKIIHKCFPDEALAKLDALKKTWQKLKDGEAASELTWLALASILRSCSPAGTAQWQYVLPNKKKKNVKDPFDAFFKKVENMKEDMWQMQKINNIKKGFIFQEDARSCASVPDNWADLIITSPPYANNYDYADATRLEMSFFGDIESWGDLHDVVRKFLIRSCTQHVSKNIKSTSEILKSEILKPIYGEIRDVCERLEKEREFHGGRKAYHSMIASYFYDLAQVWHALRRVSTEGSLVCFVVGDSAPYGIYAPVDKWLGELAVSAGFKTFEFEKTRDRNIKWKNRKHTVPLQEGRLWVHG